MNDDITKHVKLFGCESNNFFSIYSCSGLTGGSML